MKTRNIVIIIMAVFFVLAGCSTGKQGSGKTQSSSDNKVNLVIWQHEPTNQRVKAWNAVLSKFMKANPNIKVKQEVVLWEDQQNKMLSAMHAGTAPDMDVVSDTTWSSFHAANGIAPVDDIVKSINQSETYNKSALSSFKTGGHYWAVPIDSITYSLMYRPSMLKKAGYKEPPKTWTELLEYAKKMTVDKDHDGNPDVYGIGMASSRGALTTDTFSSFLATAGGDVFDRSGKIDFNNQTTMKTLDYYKKLLKYSPKGSSGWSWGELERNWASGKLAMIPYYAPNLQGFFNKHDYDIATTRMPSPNGDPNTKKLIQNHAVVVTKSAKENGHYEAVKKLLEFLAKPKNTWILTVAQEPGFFAPVTKTGAKLIQSGYYEKDLFPLKPYDFNKESKKRNIFENFMNTAIDSSKNGYTLGNKYGKVNMNLSEIYNSNVISDMVQLACLKGEPTKKAVAWAQNKMLEISE